MPLARNTFLRTIIDYAGAFGIARADLLDEIDLDPALVEQPGAFIDASKLVDIVAYAALATGRRDFGMALGRQNDHRSLGPVGVLIEHCRTVAEAVAEGSRYLHLHNAALQYTLTPSVGTYAFRLQLNARGKYPPWQYVEMCLTMSLRFCRVMLGPNWSPNVVMVEHERQSERAVYRRTFGAPVEFAGAMNALIVDKADFDTKVDRQDPRIRHLIQKLLADLDREHEENIVAKITPVLRPLLSSGNASAARVADVMGLSPRTFQRRLAERGTTFQKVLRDLRLQLVREYLSRPDMTLTELAPILGLSEASAVSRFLRASGGYKHHKRKEDRRTDLSLPAAVNDAFAAWGK